MVWQMPAPLLPQPYLFSATLYFISLQLQYPSRTGTFLTAGISAYTLKWKVPQLSYVIQVIIIHLHAFISNDSPKNQKQDIPQPPPSPSWSSCGKFLIFIFSDLSSLIALLAIFVFRFRIFCALLLSFASGCSCSLFCS